MRYGFTSTRMLHPANVRTVDWYLIENFADGDEYTTGGCWGGDEHIGETLYLWYPERTHRIVVPAFKSQVSDWWTKYNDPRIIVEQMPDDTDYRARNTRIVEHSDVLGAIAEFPEDDGHSRRSGTWMTVRIARAQGVKVFDPVLILRGVAA